MFDPKWMSHITTPTVLLETLYFSHSIITEAPMVGIHQKQQTSVAKNILKNWHSDQKRAELMGRRDKTAIIIIIIIIIIIKIHKLHNN